MNPSAQAQDDDLAWRAFRYAAGELALEESTAFEHVLDQDQRAREAVAEAVALMAAVVRAAPAPALTPAPAPRRWRSSRVRGTVGVAVAAAACLAVAVTPRLFELRSRRVVADAGAGTSTPGLGSAVALAWLGLFDEAAASSPRTDETALGLDDPEADALTPVETVADSGERIEGLPAWLIEAATLRPSS